MTAEEDRVVTVDWANLKETPPVDAFLEAYNAADNIWWMIECGHHQNLFEAAVDERDALRAEVARLREELRSIYETRRNRIVALTRGMKPATAARYFAEVDAKLAALVPPATTEREEAEEEDDLPSGCEYPFRHQCADCARMARGHHHTGPKTKGSMHEGGPEYCWCLDVQPPPQTPPQEAAHA